MPKSNHTSAQGNSGSGDIPDKGLAAFLKAHQGETHVIVLQDFPDPDAISCALAHQYISEAFSIETEILYRGRISHQQNIALVKLLRIELRQFNEHLDLKKYDGSVFLDNQGTTAEEIVHALEEANVPVFLVVDHHEPQERLHPEFSDIRNVGATATLYTQYLESGIVEMNHADDEHVRLATALMHGLYSDTNGFIRAGPEDFGAASFLSRFIDPEILEKILSQERSKKSMEIIHRSLGNRKVVESFSIAGIGTVRSEDRDAIPQAADFLVSEENVHTAIVYGLVHGEDWGEAIVGSLRTNKITLDPDEFIKDVFGHDSSGNYFGGGKESAGGFLIPVGFLSGGEDQEYQELKWQTYDTRIKQRIYEKLGFEEEEE